jgi:hypothetical protein
VKGRQSPTALKAGGFAVSERYPNSILPEELELFPYFLTYVMRETGLIGPEEEPTRMQLLIADWLGEGLGEGLGESGSQFCMASITAAYREASKSYIAGVLALHRLCLDPVNEKVLLIGATAKKPTEISDRMQKTVAAVDLFEPLRPRRDQRQSVIAWDVGPSSIDDAPSVRVSGILSPGLTGSRATFIIPDDIETLSNSITPLKQQRLAAAYNEVTAIIKVPAPGQMRRAIRGLGTPHVETSLYLELSRNRGYAIRYFPARYPNPSDENEWGCYGGNLCQQLVEEIKQHPWLIGMPTDPERFPEEVLAEKETQGTRAWVQLQYQLNCRLSTAEKYPCRLGDLLVLSLDGKALPELLAWSGSPEQRINPFGVKSELQCVGMGSDRFYHRPVMQGGWLPRSEVWRTAMAIDPSARGRDEMAWVVLAELNGNVFALDWGGTQAGFEDATLTALCEKAKQWGVQVVLPEPNYGGGMFNQILLPHMQRIYPNCSILGPDEVPWSTAQKEVRIVNTVAPLVQQHRLVVNEARIQSEWEEAERDPETGHQRTLMFQLSRVTTDRNCLQWIDRLDALAIGCAWFEESAAQDQAKVTEQRNAEKLQSVMDAIHDESGRGIEALALGLPLNGYHGGRAVGGLKRR